ncbi:MAG: hypothetical protein QHJ73_01525 [Armatimonadota bacterium]|nr:hypothetical protein [Armatimonadota bacterium]
MCALTVVRSSYEATSSVRYLSLLLLLLPSLAAAPAAAVTKTWNGSASTDWANAANWTPAGAPGPGDDVVTAVAANQPVLSGDASVQSVNVVASTRLTLNGHALAVGGDLLVTLNNTTNTGLMVTNAADVLTVGGTATFTHVAGHSSATSEGKLTAGEIHFRGNFVQTNGGGSTNGKMFTATGTKVFFDGTAPQSVSFQNPGPSCFFDVLVSNPSGVAFLTDVHVEGQLAMAGAGVLVQTADYATFFASALPVASAGYGVAVNWVKGFITMTQPAALPAGCSLFIDGTGAVLVNGQSLEVGGELTVQYSNTAGSGIHLTNPADVVTVNGSAKFTCVLGQSSATSLGKLTAGLLRVRGHFIQSSPSSASLTIFASTGTAVVLDGVAPQTLHFEDAGTTQSRFTALSLSNPAGVSLGSDVYVTGPFLNTGLCALPAGETLYLSGATAQNAAEGVLAGGGTVSLSGVTFTNNGTIRPGASPGMMTILGSFAQGASGCLDLELKGTTGITQYDRLGISGTASLDGELKVTLIGGFMPAKGDTFNVMGYSSRSGDFSVKTLPPLSGGLQLVAAPQTTQYMLGANDPTAVALAWSRVRFVGPGRVRVEWQGAEGPDVAGYHVLRSVAGETFARVNAALIPAQRGVCRYEDEAVPGVPCVYRVVIVYVSGREEESDPMAVRPAER